MGSDRVAGLVLAAGAGRRMGGPKGLLRLSASGPTFVETAVAHLRAAGLAEVHVVGGAAAARLYTHAQRAGGRVVEAADWDEGMGASLRRGLQSLDDSPAQAALVMLVDLPDVGSEVHARLLTAAGDVVGDAEGDAEGELAAVLVRAAYDGTPGHPTGRR